MSHTPEPWRFQKYKSTSIIVDCAQPDHIIGDVHSDENARRIVACVNACKNVDNETLEAIANGTMTGSEIHELAQVKVERDTYRDLCAELLKTLQDAQNTLTHCKAGIGYQHRQADTAIKVNSAITKAESILGESQWPQ